jgi:long-subunit acyl-CoA synthetase (AMP-forming)
MAVAEAPSTVAELAGFAGESFGDVVAARFKRDGEWREQTYGELAGTVERLALGLIAAGIEPGDRVCLLADTSPEWVEAAYAVWSAGAVVVPIYPTNSPEECEWVAGNSGAVAAICDNEEKLEKQAKRRDARVVDALVQAARVTAETLSDDAAVQAEVERMYSYFRTRMPDVLGRVKHDRPVDTEHHTKKLVFQTEVNGSMRDTVLDHAFLSSPEYLELVGLREAFGALGRPPYTVKLEAAELSGYRAITIAGTKPIFTSG